MTNITVYEGEYEYLMERDPNFRKFVEECEGKTIDEILKQVLLNTNCHES